MENARPHRMFVLVLLSALAAWPALVQSGKRTTPPPPPHIAVQSHASDRPDTRGLPHPTFSAAPVAAVDTFLLARFSFDDGGLPATEGWIGVEANGVGYVDTFFHVSDATELDGGDFGRLIVLEGTQSLWCGVDESSDPPFCGYATLPGYGNSFYQTFTSVAFPRQGDVELSYLVRWDSEPAYDQSWVQYFNKDGEWWRLKVKNNTTELYDGATPGSAPYLETIVIPDSVLGDSVRIRFTFASDGAFSDQDGLWPTDGAIILDSLRLGDEGGEIDFQDFESEPFGAHATNDGNWSAGSVPTIGDFSNVFPGDEVLQEVPCLHEGGVWGFFDGSPDTYACGGHPEQAALPFGEAPYYSGGYLLNEIWSPVIAWDEDMDGVPVPGSAAAALFEFDVYRDLPLNNLVFYQFRIREVINGCPASWKDDNLVYWGESKDWFRHRAQVGGLVAPTATHVQLALVARDMCGVWCGIYGDGSCHSHAPLFDNVRLLRVDTSGPSFGYVPYELFQDGFPTDGTVTGTVRIDAGGLFPPAPYAPGDSALVTVSSWVGIDDNVPGNPNSGPAVYLHVKDLSPEKSGTAVSDDSRWPVVGTGDGWTVLRCIRSGSFTSNRYAADVNDDLYEPGDTIHYYFSARDTEGTTSYWSQYAGTTSSEDAARSWPNEVTCLPANALNGVTDILYVDGYNEYGAQPFFDTAFEALGLYPDRYDILGAEAIWGNGPGSRVVDVVVQLIPYYRKIIWNTGDVRRGALGDGSGMPNPTDDFGVLFEFLDQHPNGGGVWLSGNNLASEWLGLAGSSATALRSTYMNFNLMNADHQALGLPVSPLVIASAGSCFDGPAGRDSLVAFGGGCASVTSFDVLSASGGSMVEMAYEANPFLGAVLSQVTPNAAGDTARVLLSGFSFHEIRDDRPGWPIDRVDHLRDVLLWLDNAVPAPTGVGGSTTRVTRLDQNIPNPFNPSTRIRYGIALRGPVSLRIYNVAGQLVRTLVSGSQTPRPDGFIVDWDGRNDAGQSVPSGVYFYRLEAGGTIVTRKAVLLR